MNPEGIAAIATMPLFGAGSIKKLTGFRQQ